MSHLDMQLKVRLPQDMHSLIKRVSKENNRTMNAEIVHRLQGNGLDAFTTEALIQELSRRLGGLTITQP